MAGRLPLTFATALVLGAIVAPPDAVTAVAVGRKLGLPKRVMTILTGESLINDAAALALFSIAVAQVAGTHIFIDNPLLLFGYSAVLGPVVGVALGYVTLWIRERLNNREPGDDPGTGGAVRRLHHRRGFMPRECSPWWPPGSSSAAER